MALGAIENESLLSPFCAPPPFSVSLRSDPFTVASKLSAEVMAYSEWAATLLKTSRVSYLPQTFSDVMRLICGCPIFRGEINLIPR